MTILELTGLGCWPLALLATLLVKGGPRTEREDEQRLCDAAADGDLREVQRLLASGLTPDAADEESTTALMAAAFAGHRRVVRTLLEAGADPDVQDASGQTAMMNAVIGCAEMGLESAVPVFAEIIEALLEAGADPDLEDTDGLTATDHARDGELGDLLDLLEERA
jgi:ankyrin repeat protein